MYKKIALVICTYQRPKALATLLGSVERQSFYPDQILIIDGSIDDTTAIHFRKGTIPNLEYYKVSASQRGLTKQRNFGVERVKQGIDYISFLDDDVVLEPNYFQQILDAFQEKSNAFGIGGYITNEVVWQLDQNETKKGWFSYDGYQRKEGSRFKLRAVFGLEPDLPPGNMPSFGHGRSISYLPPSGKIYQVEQLMGGVATYKRILFEDDKVFFAPALPLEEVFDPTGAGDTFAGGFAGYLTSTGDLSFENMKRAIIHGSNLASFCVEKFGTERMQNLKPEEIEKRLLKFKALTQFNLDL